LPVAGRPENNAPTWREAFSGCALCLVLLREGWIFHALPGEMYCEKMESVFSYSGFVRSVSTGKLPVEKWQEMCARAGIQDVPLIVEQLSAAATKPEVNALKLMG
jgi:hypothetical protein